MLVAAVAATTLVALTALCAAALLLAAAGRGSAGAALLRSPVPDRVVDVSGDLEVATGSAGEGAAGAAGVEERLQSADREVRSLLGRVLGPALGPDPDSSVGSVSRRVLSSSYRLPGRPGQGPGPREDVPQRLAVVAGYEALTEHAELVAGRWPGAVPDGAVADGALPSSEVGREVEVAVPAGAADALGLGPGDALRLTNTLDDSTLRVRLVGTWRPDDPGSAYWAGDLLGRTGVDRGTSFVTYGPLVTGTGTETVVADPTVRWRAEPGLGALTPGQVGDVRSSLAGLLDEDGTLESAAAAALSGEPGQSSTAGAAAPTLTVETDLDETLADVAAPVAVARSAVGLPLALVALLGVSAVLLVTRLVQADRGTDARLRASRGFSAGQLRAAHALEALILVAPAVALAPLLAWLTVRGVAAATRADAVVTSSTLGPGSWVVAAVAGLVVVLLLARQDAGDGVRGRLAATWDRVGLDLVTVPLAVLGTLQLLAYDESVLASGADEALAGAGLDPVLVLVVPVVVLAAALLIGRLVRGALLLGAGVAARARGTVAALAAWQVARRSDEHRALLVGSLLASAVVTLAITQAATYAGSQEAQARLAVGSDLRVTGLSGGDQADRVVELVEDSGGSALVVLRDRTALGDLPVEALVLDVADPAAARVLAGTPEATLEPAALAVMRAAMRAVPRAALRAGTAERAGPVPAVAATTVAAQVGEEGRARLRIAGVDVALDVVARTDAVPGTGPEADALGAGAGAGRAGTGVGLVLDVSALARVVGPALATDTETEVWASVSRDALGPVEAALDDLGRSGDDGSVAAASTLEVADRWSATAGRQDGPVGAGVRAALTLAVLTAAVLGTVGFVAAAAVGLRRRRTESAALRATGLSRRQVAGALVLERLGLLGVALLLGAAVGTALAGALGPRLVLTEVATVPVPGPVAALGLGTALLAAAVLVLMAVLGAAAVVVAATRVAARPMSADLRAGEDT